VMSVLAFPLDDTWGMHDGVGTGWGIVMLIGMFLFWGAIVVGIVWLIRAAAQGWSARGQRPVTGESTVARESPVEILERRFAEGAISPEEYRARRQVLVNGSAEPNGAHKDES
jgi:putative membrane protein